MIPCHVEKLAKPQRKEQLEEEQQSEKQQKGEQLGERSVEFQPELVFAARNWRTHHIHKNFIYNGQDIIR